MKRCIKNKNQGEKTVSSNKLWGEKTKFKDKLNQEKALLFMKWKGIECIVPLMKRHLDKFSKLK